MKSGTSEGLATIVTFIITAFGLVTKILRGRVGMDLTFGWGGWG